MKRAFRVATVFTGAAACAAVAAPAAQAAPLAAGATARVAPDIVESTCPPGGAPKLVLYYTSGHLPACFGSGGAVNVGGDPNFAKYCGGPYSGYLWINHARHYFTSGSHNLYGQRVSKVSITGLNAAYGTGNYSCSTY